MTSSRELAPPTADGAKVIWPPTASHVPPPALDQCHRPRSVPLTKTSRMPLPWTVAAGRAASRPPKKVHDPLVDHRHSAPPAPMTKAAAEAADALPPPRASPITP